MANTQTATPPAEMIRGLLRSLTQFKKEAPGVYRFHSHLLKHGTQFDRRTPSKLFPEELRAFKRVVRRPKLKECFFNSGMFLCASDKAQYWEGYHVCPVVHTPVYHAWVVMPGRRVLDLTSEVFERHVLRRSNSPPPSPADYVYWGCRVPRKFGLQSIAGGYGGEMLARYLYGPDAV